VLPLLAGRTGPPIICQVGRLVRRPGGPPCQMIEVGQTIYPVDRGRVGREGKDGSEGQSHKEEEREGRSGMGGA